MEEKDQSIYRKGDQFFDLGILEYEKKSWVRMSQYMN